MNDPINGAEWEASRADYVKSLDASFDSVEKAKADFLADLQAAYPLGRLVRVVHHRGAFEGEIVGHGKGWHESYVVVRNCRTGKTSWRWYRDVEHA